MRALLDRLLRRFGWRDQPTGQVVFAGRDWPVWPAVYRDLYWLIPLTQQIGPALAAGRLGRAELDAMRRIIAVGMCVSPRKLLRMRMSVDELARAYVATNQAFGLASKDGGEPGEQVATSVAGMTTLPGSSPAPAGPGTTSSSA